MRKPTKAAIDAIRTIEEVGLFTAKRLWYKRTVDSELALLIEQTDDPVLLSLIDIVRFLNSGEE